MAVIDSLATMISNGWNTANTNSVKPTIQVIYDHKRVDLTKGAVTGGDEVAIRLIKEQVLYSGLYKTSKRKFHQVRFEVRSGYTYAHCVLVKEEIERIMDANLTYPFSPIDEIRNPDITDLSNQSSGLYHFTLDYELRDYVLARGT